VELPPWWRGTDVGRGRGHTLNALVCPRDRSALSAGSSALTCSAGHAYPVREGIPVLLLDDVEPTQPDYWALGRNEFALDDARRPVGDERIHPYVRKLLHGTCGNLYSGVDLQEYPIPALRLEPGRGSFLDIGSNWGRWCIAAARLGYSPVGIDPAFGSVLVARHVAADVGIEAEFVVADGRHLPFADESFDVVFSYSVIQHFPREDGRATFREAARVLAPGGTLLVQMPNRYGALNLVRQAKRGFRSPGGFDVRYWSPRELRAAVGLLDSVSLEVDGFFSLNAQAADLSLLRRRHRVIVRASDALRQASRMLPPLTYIADSIYVRARKNS
jgi:SAM-dependent methyltransferase